MQQCLTDMATCHTFWLNINILGTHQAHTFSNNKCSWITVLTLPILMPLLDAIQHTVIHLFPNSALCHSKCSHHIWLLTELQHAVGSKLLYALTVPTIDTWMVFSPYCAFHLWRFSAGFTFSLTRNLMTHAVLHYEWQDLMQPCTSSNAHWKAAHGHLPGSECSFATNYP
jgi:hypothetical protein